MFHFTYIIHRKDYVGNLFLLSLGLSWRVAIFKRLQDLFERIPVCALISIYGKKNQILLERTLRSFGDKCVQFHKSWLQSKCVFPSNLVFLFRAILVILVFQVDPGVQRDPRSHLCHPVLHNQVKSHRLLSSCSQTTKHITTLGQVQNWITFIGWQHSMMGWKHFFRSYVSSQSNCKISLYDQLVSLFSDKERALF